MNNNNLHLEFLAEEPADNQVSLGNGFCVNCPNDYPELSLEEVQDLANREAKNEYKSQIQIANSSKPYCGNHAIVLKWTLYYMKYGSDEFHVHFQFENPFHYKRLASPYEAFQIGKGVGTYNVNNGRALLLLPPPQPPPPHAFRGRGRGRGRGGRVRPVAPFADGGIASRVRANSRRH